MKTKALTVSPIGSIHSDNGFYLEINKDYRPALAGLEGFSHINVLWWAHLFDDAELRSIVECEQPYKDAPESLGIFATRSPIRPNPIALSTVAVQDIDQASGKVYIAYVDAENDTPILDIKPYTPSLDRIRELSVPEWCEHWPKWYEDSASFDWDAEFVTAQ